jgi:hypothetical protein
MEWLLLLGGLTALGYAYQSGKRLGSRKGYGVGRAHGGRRR